MSEVREKSSSFILRLLAAAIGGAVLMLAPYCCRAAELLEFTATWCGPCQEMKPLIAQLKAAGYPIREVDFARNRELAVRMQVTTLPCFVLVDGGREVGRLVGKRTAAELVALFQRKRGTASTNPDVVRIGILLPTGKPNVVGESIGSGTMIGTNDAGQGLILTAAHLFHDAPQNPQVCVRWPDGSARPAKLIESHEGDDLAIVIVDNPPSTGVDLSPHDPQVGAQVCLAGYGQQGEFRQVCGQVKQIGSFSQNGAQTVRVFNVFMRDGDSGGPIFDAEGRVTGVITGTQPQDNFGSVGTCGPRTVEFVYTCLRKFGWRLRNRFGQHPRTNAQPPLRDIATLPPAGGNVGLPPLVPVPPSAERLAARVAELEQQLAAAQAAAADCASASANMSRQIDRLEEELRVARIKPIQIEQVPGPERIVEKKVPGPTVTKEVIVEKVVEVAGGWATAHLVAAGVPGWIAAAGVWVISRRAEKRLQRRFAPAAPPAEIIRTIHEPGPPRALAIDERHHNHVVEIPVSTTDAAWSRAMRIFVNAYPGAANNLKAVERLKDQILRGEPLEFPDRT